MDIKELNFLKVVVEKHPNGKLNLEYLEKPDAIGVMVFDETMTKTLLVKQYRPGYRGEIYEIPAGLMDEGEVALATMERELLEETGYTPSDYELIYEETEALKVSPGYTTEGIYLFIVKLIDNKITPQEQNLDHGEELTCHWVDVDKVGSSEYPTDMKTRFIVEVAKNRIL